MALEYNVLIGGDLLVELKDKIGGDITERDAPDDGFPAGSGQPGTRSITLLLLGTNFTADQLELTLKVKSPNKFTGSGDDGALVPPLANLLPRINVSSTGDTKAAALASSKTQPVVSYVTNSAEDTDGTLTFDIQLANANGSGALVAAGSNGVFELTLDFGYSASN